ncbi:MAG: hypothetical protein PHV28_12540 [Kiritimatiellae bacterium]|nr:hypothetical protein [Kiritimatiellia bacterium]
MIRCKVISPALLAVVWTASAATIESGPAVYRIDGKTGGIGSVVRKSDGETVVTGIKNVYSVLSKGGDLYADEKDDIVVTSSVTTDESTFVCTNPKLPGMRISKTYFPVNNGLGRRLSFFNDGDRIRFVMPFTESHFSEAFFGDSSYLGAGYIGPLIPAAKVKEPTRVEAFVQSSKGMVLLNTAHPERGNFVNMRVKVAGNPVIPWWHSTIGSYRETADRLYYLPDGWRMCLGTLDAPAKGKIVCEDRLTFFGGDLFTFFDDIYGKDPVFRDLYAMIQPTSPEFLDIFCSFSWGHEPFTRYLAEITDSGMLLSKTMLSADWADYRWKNGFNGQAGGRINAAEACDYLRGLRSISPRVRTGVYSILIAGSPQTRLFAEHPDWFRTKNRKGETQPHFPRVVENFQTMMNKPACREFLAEMAVQHAVDIEADYIYTDEAQQENTINWQQEELVRDDHSVALWSDMRTRALAAGKFLFFNGSGNPFADVNYMECSPRQSNPANWRDFAGVVLGIEMASRLRPESRIADISYASDFTSYIVHPLAVGWIPMPHGTEAGSFVSHLRAVYETGKTLPLNARYAPDWKKDPKTEIESYAVTRYSARDALLSFVNRKKTAADIQVEVDLGSLDFNPEERVNVWAYTTWYPSSPAEKQAVLSNGELRAKYRETGTNFDKVADLALVRSGAAKGMFKHVFKDVIANGTAQLVVTPGNAAIASLDGLPSQYFYTKRKGAEIKDGKVVCEAPCEIVFADAGKPLKIAKASVGKHVLAALEAEAKEFQIVRRRPDQPGAVKWEQYPQVPAVCEVLKTNVVAKGLRVTAVARYLHTHRNLRNLQTNLPPAVAEADAAELRLLAGTTHRNDSLDVCAYAGLEFSGAETLRIRLTNTFWNATSVFTKGAHVWGGVGNLGWDFAGIVVDYRGKGGKYEKRVAFSVGVGAKQLVNPLPKWGKAKAQDQLISLGNFLSEPEKTFSLDLKTFAPPDWDGTVFFAVGENHVLANRRLQATIIAVNDRSPGDFIGRKEE